MLKFHSFLNNNKKIITQNLTSLPIGQINKSIFLLKCDKQLLINTNNNNNNNNNNDSNNQVKYNQLQPTHNSTIVFKNKNKYDFTTTSSSKSTITSYRNTNLILCNLLQNRLQCRRTFLSAFASTPQLTKKHITKVLKFTPKQVYDVVVNVQSYKEFLPFCLNSTIKKVVDPNSCFEAELTVGYGNLKESYTSRVKFDEPKYIEASAIDSHLFVALVSEWNFKPGPTDSTCTAVCSLEYQFRSPLYATLMDEFIGSSLETMVDAFESRCKQTYRKH
ncbi:putative coenzyme Q-binding protein [Heterostelium album PN500]|uniref:Putative coenzyme Q-binding protein n=1 Tax=Heterostelium pallidum (strain ATCC 26659 / Pp 5 / PN500) TaxID=670386 RepID=D3BFE1_HETP5|nr:putative coenzyme Q-binding protein [Heterostelium album PN500]EFA79855.1 putative coenzyme Q-binding protein [Heterostelium album PN500]|eukprot:XP_020431976.1 putative coenzyme Q-binding protein [Heterostelium album PN500]